MFNCCVWKEEFSWRPKVVKGESQRSRPKVWSNSSRRLKAGRMSLVTGIRVKCGNANKYKEFGKSERDREERLGRKAELDKLNSAKLWYRLKCSKAISGWAGGRTEISDRTYSKSTCGANKSTCGANKWNRHILVYIYHKQCGIAKLSGSRIRSWVALCFLVVWMSVRPSVRPDGNISTYLNCMMF